MKRKALLTILLTLCLCLCVAFTACGGNETDNSANGGSESNSENGGTVDSSATNSSTDNSSITDNSGTADSSGTGNSETVDSGKDDNTEQDQPHEHSYGEWQTTKEPTCTEAGCREKACSVCSDVIAEEIKANGHTFENMVCTICNSKKTSEGLAYELSSDGNSYLVTGIGTCEDTDIVIPTEYEGKPVTSISRWAFRGCEILTSIVIPNSVTSIGDSAFFECESLVSVVIPNSVTRIENYAFFCNYNLTSIVIPSSVTYIGNDVFDECEALTIYCEATSKPNGWVSDLRANCPVVWDCNNNDIATNGYIYTVVDGLRYRIKDNKAVVVEQPRNINKAIIRASIEYKDVDYPVTAIDLYAFEWCMNLTSIEIPNSVTQILGGAFYKCVNLMSIEIPSSVTFIHSTAFEYCSKLTNIIVNENNATYISQNGVLYTKDMKELIRYPEGKKETSFMIPKSVTSIDNWAFEFCRDLTAITFEEGSQLTSIGNGSFNYCDSLKSIEIPSSVTSIGSEAFRCCKALTNLIIWENVTNISYGVFGYCDSLTLYVESESKQDGWSDRWMEDSECLVIWGYVMSNGIVYSKDGDSVTVARQPITIEGDITISESITYKGESYPVTSIGNDAFSHCTSLTSVVIPNSVTSIGEKAFYNCDGLTSIEIPSSVTSIGKYAFEYCINLTSVTFGEGSQLTSIGYEAFYGCRSLTSITIPNSVTSIGYEAFYGCMSLTICCEAGSQPDGWHSDWNDSNCPVVWGYKQEG